MKFPTDKNKNFHIVIYSLVPDSVTMRDCGESLPLNNLNCELWYMKYNRFKRPYT